MREILKLGGKLLLLTAVAGLALGLTNAITKGPIEEQAVAAANAARQTVLGGAETFEQVLENENGMDEIHRGLDASGNVVGYTGKITTRGYGGPIEVTVGVDAEGKLAGIQCGGSGFSETAGLGAKVKTAAFSDQFAGLATPVALTKDGGEVDSVTAASISSGAVCNAVNIAAEYIAGLA